MHKANQIPSKSQSFIGVARTPTAHPPFRPSTSTFHTHRIQGNQSIGNVLQAKLKMSTPGDHYEQQADQIADQIMRGSNIENSQLSPAKDIAQLKHDGSENASQQPHVWPPNDGGSPLPYSIRDFFEPKFNRDLSQVRIHTGNEASQSAESINAKAFTMGQNVVFNKGQYDPATSQGQRLLAHELTHTIQQSGHTSASHEGMVQREENTPDQSSAGVSVTDIFPFPKDSQVVLGRIMNDWILKTISKSKDPRQQQMAAALNAIHGLKATVITATPDAFVATANNAVTLPAQGKVPARKLADLTLSLHRSGTNFTFSMTAKEGKSTAPTPLMPPQTGLTAKKNKDGAIILSSTINGKTVPELSVTQQGDSAMIEVFTQKYLPTVSKILPTVEAISVNKLPDAKKEADVEKASQKILSKQASARRSRSHQVNFGIGGAKIDDSGAFLLRSSLMFRFPSTGIASLFTDNQQIATGVGQVINIPLEAQILYTPPSSILGTLATGIGARLPTSVPVNISILGGVGGGTMQFPTDEGKERRGVFGPTFGGSAGVEFGTWRINVRTDHLWNIIKDSQGETTGITTFSGNIGVGF